MQRALTESEALEPRKFGNEYSKATLKSRVNLGQEIADIYISLNQEIHSNGK